MRLDLDAGVVFVGVLPLSRGIHDPFKTISALVRGLTIDLNVNALSWLDFQHCTINRGDVGLCIGTCPNGIAQTIRDMGTSVDGH